MLIISYNTVDWQKIKSGKKDSFSLLIWKIIYLDRHLILIQFIIFSYASNGLSFLLAYIPDCNLYLNEYGIAIGHCYKFTEAQKPTNIVPVPILSHIMECNITDLSMLELKVVRNQLLHWYPYTSVIQFKAIICIARSC